MDKEVRKLQINEANTFGALNPLISFNCLIDTDFGLLVLIAQKFFDTDIFDEDFFKDNDDIDDMKYVIYNRKEKNPLTLCLKNKDDADDYYNQFINKYYKEILFRSMKTDLSSSLNKMSKSGAQFSILCKNKIEFDFIKENHLFDKYQLIMIDDMTNLSIHYQYFFKDFSDIPPNLFNYKFDMRDRQFYIARYSFNELDSLSSDEDIKMLKTIVAFRGTVSKFDLYHR